MFFWHLCLGKLHVAPMFQLFYCSSKHVYRMWNLEVLGFVEEGKLENKNDNQRQAQPTCQFWVCNLNAGHIGGRRVCSHHCTTIPALVIMCACLASVILDICKSSFFCFLLPQWPHSHSNILADQGTVE